MKSEKGISVIILLIIIIIVLSCVFVFINSSNNNTTKSLNENNTSSTNTNTNINTTTKNASKIIGSWQTGVFIYTFNENGTATLSGNGINTQNFTYEIEGNKISLTNIENNASIELEYSIEDDTLYIGSESYIKVK